MSCRLYMIIGRECVAYFLSAVLVTEVLLFGDRACGVVTWLICYGQFRRHQKAHL